MGRDKALLPFAGATLVEHVAAQVRAAAGSVTLVGDPLVYGSLGLPVLPDRFPGCGPLAGIQAALEATSADWNLVLACDLPAASSTFLNSLLAAAEASGADAWIPTGPSGLAEPLCAVYHARCREPVAAALQGGDRKILDGLRACRVHIATVRDITVFQNCNTPEDWAGFLARGAPVQK